MNELIDEDTKNIADDENGSEKNKKLLNTNKIENIQINLNEQLQKMNNW